MPAYPPVGQRSSRGLVLGVAAAVAAVLVAAFCGGAAFLVSRSDESQQAAGAAAPEIPAGPVPTDFPTGFPGLPTDIPTDFDLPTAWPTDGASHRVVLEAGGAGPAQVMYAGSGGPFDLEKETVTLPWRRELAIRGTVPLALTVAVGSDGTVTCRISVDGADVLSDSSTQVAICLGAFPR